jgi:hypothetical protein
MACELAILGLSRLNNAGAGQDDLEARSLALNDRIISRVKKVAAAVLALPEP